MPVRIAELEIRVSDNTAEVIQRVDALRQAVSRPIGTAGLGASMDPLIAALNQVKQLTTELARSGGAAGSALTAPVRAATRELEQLSRAQRQADREREQLARATLETTLTNLRLERNGVEENLRLKRMGEREESQLDRARTEDLRIRQRLERDAVTENLQLKRIQQREEKDLERARTQDLQLRLRLEREAARDQSRVAREVAREQSQAMRGLSQDLVRLNDPRATQRQTAAQDPRVQGALARFDQEQKALATSLGNWSQYVDQRQRLEDQLVNQVLRSQNEQTRAMEQSVRERERLADQQRASFERMFSAGRQGPPGVAGLAIGGIGDLLAPALGAGAGPAGLAAGMLSNVAGQFTGGVANLVRGTVETVFTGVRDLVTGVASLAQGAVQGVVSLFTGIAGTIGGVITGFRDFFGEIAKGALTLGLAYAGIKTFQTALDGLLTSTVEFNATLERSQASWGRFLRPLEDTRRAASEWAKDMQMYIQQTAIATSFGFVAVDRSARQLLQAGLSLGDILPDARTGVQGLQGDILDLAASQQDPLKALDRLSLALGQVKQAGRLTGEEMRQLRNDGVSIPEVFAKIAEQMGVTTAKVYEMQRAGQLTSDIFFKGFRAWTSENFGGLAQAQAATLIGAWEQIKEAANVVLGRGTEPAFRLFSAGMQSLARAITGPEALQMAARFAGLTEAIIGGAQRLWEGFRGPLMLLVGLVQETGHKIYEGLQWLNPFARHSPSLVESVEEGVQRVIDAYSRMGREVPELLTPIASAMTSFRAITAAGLEKIDFAQFQELSKALVNIAPGAPAAYRELQLAIRGIREEAAQLSPEIVLWTNRVRELEAANAEAKRGVDEVKDAVAEAEAGLRHYDTSIREHKNSQLELQVQLAMVKEEYQAQVDALRPLEDALDAQNRQVDQARRAYTLADLDVRRAEQGLRDLKEAVEDQTLVQGRLQEQLNRSRDALSSVNDALSDTKRRLSDVLDQPLEGTAKYTEQIQAAQTAVERIQMQILNRRASGAASGQLEGLNRQLDRARANLDLIQQRKRLEIDIPEERLHDLAQFKGPELSLGAKEDQVRNLANQVSLLDKAKQIAEDQVRTRQAAVRDAQAELLARKETLERENDRIDPLRKIRDLAKESLTNVELERDRLKEMLEIEKDRLQPTKDRLTELERLIEREGAAINLLTLQKEQAHAAFVQPLLDAQEAAEKYQEAVNRELTPAKENLNDLVTAQRALLSLAQAWQSELDDAANKAKAAAELQKKGAGEGQGAAGDRTAGGEALGRFRAAREALAKEQAQAKTDFEQWWAGLIRTNDERGATAVSSFLGRLQGLFSGLADAWGTGLRSGLQPGLDALWGTLQDVAVGLPDRVGEWVSILLGWTSEVVTGLGENLPKIGDAIVDFITGKSQPIADETEQHWAVGFWSWVEPAGKALLANLDTVIAGQLLPWIKLREPEIEAQLDLWRDQFWAWAQPIWEGGKGEAGGGLRGRLNEVAGSFLGWVGEIAGLLGVAIGQEWVPTLIDWVTGGKKAPQDGSVLSQVDPKMLALAQGFDKATRGTAVAESLKAAGGQLMEYVWTGMEREIGTWPLRFQQLVITTVTDGKVMLGNDGQLYTVGWEISDFLLGGFLGAITAWPTKLATAINEALAKLPSQIRPPQIELPVPTSQLAPSAPFTGPGTVPLPPRVEQPEGDPGAWWEQSQRRINEGAASGIDFSGARNRAVNEAQDLVTAVQNELEIHSPSGVFQRIGESIGDGLALGINNAVPKVGQSMKNLLNAGYPNIGEAQGSFSVSRYTNVADDPAYQRWLELFGGGESGGSARPVNQLAGLSREAAQPGLDYLNRMGLGAWASGVTSPLDRMRQEGPVGSPYLQYLQPPTHTPLPVASGSTSGPGNLGMADPSETSGTGTPRGRRDQPPEVHFEPHITLSGHLFADIHQLARAIWDVAQADLLADLKAGGA